LIFGVVLMSEIEVVHIYTVDPIVQGVGLVIR